MKNTNILFWIVAIPTLSLLYSAVRHERAAARGWIIKSVAILVVLMCAAQFHSTKLIYLAAGLWLLFVLLPNLLAKPYNKYIIEQEFTSARRLARFISFLHPFDGWREQPRIVHALELAQQGHTDDAVKILHEFQRLTSPSAIVAMVNLFRITYQWEEFLAWIKKQPYDLESEPSFLPTLLRARGEVGDIRGLVEFFQKNKNQIARIGPTNSDFCRLVLFAFTGRRDLVERVFQSGLTTLPEQTKQFWLATADITAGRAELGHQHLIAQLESADAWNRRAIQHRLATPLPTADSLDPAHLRLIEDAATEHTHEQIFDTAPPLRETTATRVLIILNLAMFALEMYAGGSTNGQTLLDLGAVSPELVQQGQTWRLIAALFLHFGAIHIAMNMINLSVIGPFVENAFGFAKFLLLYFIAGIGSMFIVTKLSRYGFTVGASGAIMGLVGATGALMLKGWLHHSANPAKRRFKSVLSIVAMQTVFDAIIPQVSMTAHLSGAVIGFVLGILLPDRLNADATNPGAR
jgi:rhomboid protease GluP